jgi:uncharacterized protein (DUF1330 family)
MTAYAAAHLREVTMGPEIADYLRQIDATLAPFDGRFVVHGGDIEVLEGSWPGFLIMIEFPDRGRARSWYESPAYQRILPLRTNNSEGDCILIDGASDDHLATDVLAGTGFE